MLKRTKMKRIVWLILCIWIFGCQDEKKPHEAVHDVLTTIHVNPSKRNTKEDFLKLVEDVRFLPLETKNENPIDWVRKLWVTDKSIFVKTRNAKEIHRYGADGSFKFKVEKKGKGKKELSWIFDFCPALNEGVYVLGYNQYYEFDSLGQMNQEVPLKAPFSGFEFFNFFIVNDTFSIFSASGSGYSDNLVENNSIWVYNKDTKQSQFCMYKSTKGIATGVFHQSNDIILVNPYFGLDTIYAWQNNMVQPLYSIDFGDFKTPIERIPVDYHNGWVAVDFLSKNYGCLFIQSAFMTDNWLLFTVTCNSDLYEVFYHKQKKEALLFNVSDELHRHVFFGTPPKSVFRNEIIRAIPAHVIVEKRESNSLDFRFLSPQRHQELMAQLKDVKETDNPVLMFVKMKAE